MADGLGTGGNAAANRVLVEAYLKEKGAIHCPDKPAGGGKSLGSSHIGEVLSKTKLVLPVNNGLGKEGDLETYYIIGLSGFNRKILASDRFADQMKIGEVYNLHMLYRSATKDFMVRRNPTLQKFLATPLNRSRAP